jgi:hypothetical protein
MAVADLLRLAGYAVGAVGGTLVFVEFLQVPSYVEYEPEFDTYSLTLSPAELREYTLAGRVGGLCLAVGFALLFVAALVG